MSLGRGIGFGIALAVAGVAVWLGLSWMSGWTLMLLAIVVAGCVGGGVGYGNGGRGGAAAGVSAGVIAVCAALVGRFYAVQFAFIAEAREDAAMLGEDDAIMSIAEQLAEREGAGGGPGADEDDDESGSWDAALMRWNGMTSEEQETYLTALREDRHEKAGQIDFGVGLLLSVLTLRIFDLVCIGLSASTAFATASRRVKDELDAQAANTPGGKPVILEEAPLSSSNPFARLGQEASAKDKAA